MQRLHSLSSHGQPPLIARSIVGLRSKGPPFAHIRSFYDWHSTVGFLDQRLTGLALLRCALGKDGSWREPGEALCRVLQTPPEMGGWWCLGAISGLSAGRFVCSSPVALSRVGDLPLEGTITEVFA
ncbi:hypothetical protein AS156_23125 [Bradyrhizobium macuxiense]|uniref:Uncharacterized protein n=1 Tax=Bradyrhizobium macuxiense TaxID=1755647 RepID=A0A125Q5U8_9BRAD|nr:hypothetical protein AS156_23125 [Bradyrhizobium macuxiense]